jgi:long-chain acyl-CoA synthetase
VDDTDLAIWMQVVSVPLYPTLAVETVRQILTHANQPASVGKLDGWETMKPGVPAATYLCVSYRYTAIRRRDRLEGWDAICARTEPMPGNPLRGEEELATLDLHPAPPVCPRAMQSFWQLRLALNKGIKRIPMSGEGPHVVHLPLAHG